MEKLLEPQTLTILLIFGIPVISIITYYWYKIQKVRSDNNLKRRLVESGLSVEEIERVLNAGGGKADDD